MKITHTRGTGQFFWVCAIALCGLLLAVLPLHSGTFAEQITFTQPDGAVIELWGEGHDFHAVFETLDGFTVVFDPDTRSYQFARLDNNGDELLPTGVQVHAGNPAALGLTKHLRVKPESVKRKVAERRKKWDDAIEVSKRWAELKENRPAAEASARALREAKAALSPAEGSVQMESPDSPLPAPPTTTTTGTKVGLCLLIDFDDDPATIPQAEIINLCNQVGYTGYGNNGSVRDYFYSVSDSLLTYTNVVTIYIRIPNSTHHKSWYNDTTKDAGYQANYLIRDAIAIMKALPNYNSTILPTFNNLTVNGANEVVACNVYYAGGNGGVWSKGLWPHSWSLAVVGAQSLSAGGKKVKNYQVTNIGTSLRIGTFCHENGHMLCGFPDLYDYDGDSVGGAGRFCLMGNGGGLNDKKTPAQVCAYLKRAAGWATTSELSSSSSLVATVSSVPGTRFNHFYRYAKPGVPTEYFLIENRYQSGRDTYLPAAGVAIWHIDELGDRDNQSLAANNSHLNYEATLVQADNSWHFQNNVNNGDSRDLYYEGNTAAAYSNEFRDSSTPNAHWWSGANSGLVLRDFSDQGETMTFTVGAGTPISLATALDTTGITWITGGNADWFGQTATRHDGVDAAQSGTITHSEYSYVQTTIVGPGTLRFWWRVSSEATYDHLSFYIDGTLKGRISGEVNWVQVVTNLSSGTHTLKWQYYKDSVVTGGSDRGWLDQVDFDGVAPFVTTHPYSATVNVGANRTFYVYASGTPTLTYQWRKNGVNISGATSYYYTVTNAQPDDAAGYSARIVNSYGSVISDEAVLGVIANNTNLTLNVVDCGWYDHSGKHTPSLDNFLAGKTYSGGSTNFYRDFFVFNVPVLPRPLVSAKLRVKAFSIQCPTGSETYNLWYVSTDVDTLTAGGTGLTNIYNDLGGASTFGSRTFVTSEAQQFVEVPLNSTFRANYTSSSNARFALGGSISTLSAEQVSEFVFGSSSAGAGNTNVQLILQIEPPIPPSIVTHPQSVYVDRDLTNSATFTVEAAGSAPLSYQWLRNGQTIDGATGDELQIGPLHATNSGRYACRVANPYGSVVSSNAFLVVITGGTNITLNAFDTGWYNSLGYHDPGNANYIAGQYDPSFSNRNFFAFDIPAIPRTVQSAELYINTYSILSYRTGSASDYETYYLRSVSTPVSTLVAGGSGLTSIYNDLADGTYYGGRTFYTNEAREFVSITLNSSAISAIRAAQGREWAMGGYLTTLDTDAANDEYVFGSSFGRFGDVQIRLRIEPAVAPSITQHPVGKTVLPGSNVTFSVVATGTSPLRYQWRKGSTPIPGATSSSYTILNVQPVHAGRYSVVVTNDYGTATSANALLKVVVTEGVVGYYTDNNPGTTNPQPSIVKAGFDPVHIISLASFDLSTIDLLVLNEADNRDISSALSAKLPAIQNWILAGGKLIVHDRSAGNLNPSPLVPGASGVTMVRQTSADINVISPATTLVTEGPFGRIISSTLDGGNWSLHGYADRDSLPATARPILCLSNYVDQVGGFSYALGKGFVYYSGIPADAFLGGSTVFASNLTEIYLPNVLYYMHTLRSVPTVGYYTDQNEGTTTPEAPIRKAGYEPTRIDDILSFDFTQIDLLMLNESDNWDVSPDLTSRLPEIRTWVALGGRIVTHDRGAGNLANPSPFLFGTGAILQRQSGRDIGLIPPATTTVTAGPFGVLDDESLDGGTSSSHGYAEAASLPGSTRPILSLSNEVDQVVAFSYSYGYGTVYYSTIPLDYYLAGGSSTMRSNTVNIYTPNVLRYTHTAGKPLVVGYYTDNNNVTTNPEPAILAAGYTPLHITNLATFDFSRVHLLLINENSNTSISSEVSNRLDEIQAWVMSGGKFMVHDRSAGNVADPCPFLVGAPGALLERATSNDIDVIPPGTTLVTAGPFGTLGNTSLDGGNSSAHGYARMAGLPAGTSGILSHGLDTSRYVAMSYPLGLGFVYYSTIPLDYFLAGGSSVARSNVVNIYTPNALVYLHSLQSPPLEAPVIRLTRTVSQSRVEFQSAYATYYILEYKNSLDDLSWTQSGTGLFGTGEWATMIDPSPAVPTRFYRLRLK